MSIPTHFSTFLSILLFFISYSPNFFLHSSPLRTSLKSCHPTRSLSLSDTQISPSINKNQTSPQIATLLNGGFVISWATSNDEPITFQIFNSNGTSRTSYLQYTPTDTLTGTKVSFPAAITELPNGDFVIQSYTHNTGMTWSRISTAIFGPNGETRTQLYGNLNAHNWQVDSVACVLKDGGFVTVWEVAGGDGNSWGVFASLFNADGTRRVSDFQVNVYTAGDQSKTGVAALGNGNFVISWHSYLQDSSSYGIYAKIYTANGVVALAEFQVNVYYNLDQFYPSITSLVDGGFAVTWMSWAQDGSDFGIIARIFEYDGTPRTSDIIVNTITADAQKKPVIQGLHDGNFVIGWPSHTADSTEWDIYARIVKPDGSFKGTSFRVNSETLNTQDDPVIAVLVDGGFVIAYDSNQADYTLTRTYLKRYNYNGIECGLTDTQCLEVCDTTSNCLDPTISHCNTTGHRCLKCLSNSECYQFPGKSFCGTSGCEPCVLPTHCNSPTNSRCISGDCLACLIDNDCSHIPGMSYCISGTCQACDSSSNCCGKSCTQCTGTQCEGCASFAVLNQSGDCLMNSQLTISGLGTVSVLNPLRLSALAEPEESGYSPISYTWTVASNSSNITTLSDYLAAQSLEHVEIPAGYLEKGVEYNFTALYFNFAGNLVSTMIKVETGSDFLPAFVVDGGGIQKLKRDRENTLRLIRQYSGNLSSVPPLEVEWDQIAGPDIGLRTLVNSENPLWIIIPKCTLKANASYVIQAMVYGQGYARFNTFVSIQIFTENDTFSSQILGGNRDQPYNQPLNLEGKAVFDAICSDTSQYMVIYRWACRKSAGGVGNYAQCTDSNSIFGTPYINQSKISIPSTYFSINDVLEITLNVTVNGVTAFSSNIITIGGANALSIEITCEKADCLKYTAENPSVFQGKVQNEPFSSILSYNWTVTPLIPFATFQDQLKFTGSLITNLGASLQLSLNIRNTTHTGNAFIEIQYNYPPQGGSLSVDPPTGNALDTYFSLVAYHWIDEDVPFSYQFFSSPNISNNEWTVLTNPQQYSYTSTWLSGKSPSQTIFLKAVVSDCLFATNTANTTVLVNFPVLSTADAIEKVINALDTTLTSTDAFEANKIQTLLCAQILSIEENAISNGTVDDASRAEAILAKLKLLNSLDAGYNAFPTEETKDNYINSLRDLTTSTLR